MEVKRPKGGGSLGKEVDNTEGDSGGGGGGQGNEVKEIMENQT